MEFCIKKYFPFEISKIGAFAFHSSCWLGPTDAASSHKIRSRHHSKIVMSIKDSKFTFHVNFVRFWVFMCIIHRVGGRAATLDTSLLISFMKKHLELVWCWFLTGYLMLRLSTFAEAGAGLLPLALSAPQLPVLHSINFSAFLGVTPGPPQRRLGGAGVGLGRQPDIFARWLQ